MCIRDSCWLLPLSSLAAKKKLLLLKPLLLLLLHQLKLLLLWLPKPLHQHLTLPASNQFSN